ncbi:GxxExxY protein [Algoriphagus namhaensis]
MESVYEKVLIHEWKKEGAKGECQVIIPFQWDKILPENGSGADLIVREKVLVDITSVQSISPVHS